MTADIAIGLLIALYLAYSVGCAVGASRERKRWRINK
jgi:hypothetical protein